MSKAPCTVYTLILYACVVSATHAGGRSGALNTVEPNLVILSTHVDTEQHRLLIAGANFGQRPPAVTLGERTLPVLHASATEIVAGLPADLPASTYLLRVRSANRRHNSDTFSLPIHKQGGSTP